jgi:hypothetical protein
MRRIGGGVGRGGRVGGGRICGGYDAAGNGAADAGEVGRSSGTVYSGFANANASGNGSDESANGVYCRV